MLVIQPSTGIKILRKTDASALEKQFIRFVESFLVLDS